MADKIARKKLKIRAIMEPIRKQVLRQNSKWIKSFEPVAMNYFVDGKQIVPERIQPVLELVDTPLQQNLWRYCRYLSSMPYTDYVGRRMYFLIRDASIESHPIMGIAAIGSSVMQVGDRDRWIGWKRNQKRKRIVYMMDLYTAVAIPPYSDLLAGKLILYMMVSNEVRQLFAEKYRQQRTMKTRRLANDLVLLCSTSLYGIHSSQFNRVKYQNQLLYIPIGETLGYGTFHISHVWFRKMRNYLEENGFDIDSNLSGGVNWRMRVARTYFQTRLGSARARLNHGNKRGIFIAPLAQNTREFLRGDEKKPKYFDWPLADLICHWKTRWLEMRAENLEVLERLKKFKKKKNQLSLQIEKRRC